MTTQHLPGDLVWPSSGLKELAQTMKIVSGFLLFLSYHVAQLLGLQCH